MKQAFSLVELSIVLVILGLLIGGILTGQSLIRASELRSIATQHSSFQTAMFGFRDRYLSLPGDLNNASDFWSTATNGDGDRMIEAASGASAAGEMFGFWQQLSLAGMVEGAYSGTSGAGGATDATIGTNVPEGKLGNAGWSVLFIGSIDAADTDYFTGSYGNAFVFGNKTTNDITSTAIILPEEMWGIDTKVDDGEPEQGKVRALENLSAADDTGCSNTTTGNYAVQNTARTCALIFSE